MMLKRFPYLLLFILLLGTRPVAGQYLDTICVGTAGVGYHVIGLPGSTYTWTIQGGTQSPLSNQDSVFVNWGMIPGVYPISVLEHSAAGCDGDLMIAYIWVTGLPWVSAGPDVSICSGSV